MKVLVTGGGGFLGNAIVRKLLNRGFAVRSFSRGSYPALRELGVEVLRGNLTDSEAVKAACEGCETVFHVAAKAGIWGAYPEYYSTNVVGTVNVIEACRFHRIPKLIYTSSPSVIFDGTDMEGIDESVGYPSKYKAAYPKSKSIAECSVLRHNGSTLATVALRPHLIWGPGDTHLVPGIIARGKVGKLKRIGKQDKLVDFTFIEDAAEAHLQAADCLAIGSSVAGRAFFISQGQPLPLWGFVNRVLAAAELPPVTKTISPNVAYFAGILCETLYSLLRLKDDPPMTRFLAEELSTAHWFDIGAAKRNLAYSPKTSIEEGFTKLEEWFHSGAGQALLR